MIGLIYAAVLGFFSILVTGGGHGNFIWPELFFNVFCFGIFYPINSAFVVDLRQKTIRLAFGTIIALETIIIVLRYLGGGISDKSAAETLAQWKEYPTDIVLMGVLFAGPFVVYMAAFVYSLARSRNRVSIEPKVVSDLK